MASYDYPTELALLGWDQGNNRYKVSRRFRQYDWGSCVMVVLFPPSLAC
jgi:hypothetical protein